MGLDMYLEKRTYIGANYKHNNVKGEINLTKDEDNKSIKIDLTKVTEITEEVMYWRKFNALHSWFVKNCQNGEDDCRDAYVSRDQLKALVDTLKKVRDSLDGSPTKDVQYETGWTTKNGVKETTYATEKVFINTSVAEELLPTQGGFFFGGTAYSEYYLERIKETIDVLEKELENNDGGSYYYSSSW